MLKFELTVGVGRLLCRPVRDFLKRCQFDGKKIEFYEDSGLVERTFIIKGDDEDVTSVRYSLEKWCEANNFVD